MKNSVYIVYDCVNRRIDSTYEHLYSAIKRIVRTDEHGNYALLRKTIKGKYISTLFCSKVFIVFNQDSGRILSVHDSVESALITKFRASLKEKDSEISVLKFTIKDYH